MLLVAGSASCSKDYLQLGPESSTTEDRLFSSPTTAQYLINGICKQMQSQYQSEFGQGYNGEGTIMLYFGEYPGLDCQRKYPSISDRFNFNYFNKESSTGNYFCWYYYYKIINNANIAITQIEKITEGGSTKEWDYVLAQALYFRAYCYQQLVQWYSRRWSDKQGESRGVPLRLDAGTDPIKAVSLKKVYKQVYDDLDRAIALFTSCGVERTDKWHPNIDCCHAAYSRAAINREDWETAATHAAALTTNKDYSLMGTDEYNKGFNEPNKEWIWEAFCSSEQSIYYYAYHAYTACNGNTSQVKNQPYSISKELVEQIPDEDSRKALYIIPTEEELEAESEGFDRTEFCTAKTSPNFYARVRKDFPILDSAHKIIYYQCLKIKVKDGTQYGINPVCVFRLAEFYYNLAEAKYELGDEPAARTALETAVKPYNAKYSAADLKGEALRDEIRKYRRFDLFLEGRAFPDLKRWGVDHIRHTWDEGGNWNVLYCGTSTTGGCYDKTGKNNWCLCYPSIETNYNGLVTTFEPENWVEE